MFLTFQLRTYVNLVYWKDYKTPEKLYEPMNETKTILPDTNLTFFIN